jgi:hypothetical protein
VDHDHADPALHQDSWAMTLVARASGYPGPIPRGVHFSEVEVKEGYAYLCRTGGVGSGLGPLPQTFGGFLIINVSNPRAPTNEGDLPGVACVDIKANDAGDLVFYGTQRNRPDELLLNQADVEQKQPRGLYLVNVADKAAPFVERFVPIPPNGVHTVHYATVEGRELVTVQTYDHLPDAGLGLPGVNTGMQNPATQRIQVFEVVQGQDGMRDLALLGAWNLPEPAPPGTNYFPHDTTLQKHPLTGQWLGYVAYWDHGLVVLDFADPANPNLVGRNADTTPSAHVNSHQARPFPGLIAGRHVTVLEPEIESADEPGQFTLFDTSDPARPERLGYFRLPGEVIIPGGFLFSPHNFNLAHGRIYLAHNHGGVWVVDASTEERLRQPVPVGFYQPHLQPGEREATDDCAAPRVWSAFHVAGFVYASDSCSGLNILQFDGDRGLEGQGPRRVMPTQ